MNVKWVGKFIQFNEQEKEEGWQAAVTVTLERKTFTTMMMMLQKFTER